MIELVATEGILGIESVDTNMAKDSSSKPKSKGKGGKKKKDYTKGKCFHCGDKGHWKRNCPKFIADKNEGVMRSFLLEI